MEPTREPSIEPSGRYLRLLGREEFARLMGACIESVLERRGGLAPGEARRLRWESLRSFSGLLAARARRVRAVTKSQCLAELERTHGALLRERVANDAELLGLERELAQARCTLETSVLLPAEEEALSRALAADLTAVFGSARADAREHLITREAERRRAALAGVVARERERIDLLERRLVKLQGAQVELEKALDELARRAQIDGGIASIYDSVQGLSTEESEREAKAAMLEKIFEQNFELQKKELVPMAPTEPKVEPDSRLQQKSA